MSAVSTGEPFVAHTGCAIARVWGNVSARCRWGASISMKTRCGARPSGKSPYRYLNCRNVPAMFASPSGPLKSNVDRASSGLIPDLVPRVGLSEIPGKERRISRYPSDRSQRASSTCENYQVIAYMSWKGTGGPSRLLARPVYSVELRLWRECVRPDSRPRPPRGLAIYLLAARRSRAAGTLRTGYRGEAGRPHDGQEIIQETPSGRPRGARAMSDAWKRAAGGPAGGRARGSFHQDVVTRTMDPIGVSRTGRALET